MATVSSSDKAAVNGIRIALGIGGALALIIGLAILIWPGRTALVVVVMVAIYAIAGGLLWAALGIFSKSISGWSRVGYIVLGVLFIVAGIVAFANLGPTLEVFGVFVGILVGILWIVEGVVSLTNLGGARSRGWSIFFAIISILAGIILLFAPLWGALVLWVLLGISLVVLGIVQIVRAFTFGNDI